MWVQSLGQKDPLEKEVAIYSSILAWKIPWTKEPGGLQSMGSQSVGHNSTAPRLLGSAKLCKTTKCAQYPLPPTLTTLPSSVLILSMSTTSCSCFLRKIQLKTSELQVSLRWF